MWPVASQKLLAFVILPAFVSQKPLAFCEYEIYAYGCDRRKGRARRRKGKKKGMGEREWRPGGIKGMETVEGIKGMKGGGGGKKK